MAETVRIDPASHTALSEIAKAKHIPLTEALARAVETYRRAVFLEGVAADFAADEDASEDAAQWNAANDDGLHDE